MKQILNEWKRFVEQQEKKVFLRFGDPTKAAKTSMIHDPETEYDAEMKYFSQDPDGPRLQRYEAGISAYPVILQNEEKVVFKVPVGLQSFQGQVKGFLFDRLLAGEIYLFSAKQIYDKNGEAALGTDREPLVEKDSVENVVKIPHRELYVEESGEHNVYDMIKSSDLKFHFIQGYPHIADSAEGIKEYFSLMKEKFTNPESIAVLEDAEKLYLEEFKDQ